MKIAVIPGHRPRAKGAYSKFINLYEYEYNEGVAIKLVNALNTNGKIKAQLILRPNDEMSEHQALNLLCQAVKRAKADYAIELHCNSSENELANGAEVLVYHKTSAKNKTAAKIFLKMITVAIGNRERGVKLIGPEDAGHHFLRGVPCPAIILEPGFFSSRKESILLLDRRREYAEALNQACKYLFEIFGGE